MTAVARHLTRLLPWLWAAGLAALVALTTGFRWQIAVGAVLMAVASLVMVPATSGNRLSLCFAVVAAFPLLYRQGPDLTGPVALDQALAAAATGLVLIWVLRVARRETGLDVFAALVHQSVGIAGFLLAYVSLEQTIVSLGWFEEGEFGTQLVALTVAGITWFLVETFFWAYVSFSSSGLSRRYLWILALHDWPVSASLFATGALFGVAYPVIGPAAVAVAVLPYAFAHLAFYRYQETRRTYGQTIRALSRIPEVAGLSPEGHSDRTSDLAVAIAQEIGMSPDHVTELRYAALMHDIGRITLNEPNIIRMGFTDEDIARWGAEIISEAPYLNHVAELVRGQHNPYRRPGEKEDESLPMSSKIIKVASAYDHATVDLGMSPLEALEILHRGAAYDFDPQVVHAIRKVLVRRRIVAD